MINRFSNCERCHKPIDYSRRVIAVIRRYRYYASSDCDNCQQHCCPDCKPNDSNLCLDCPKLYIKGLPTDLKVRGFASGGLPGLGNRR